MQFNLLRNIFLACTLLITGSALPASALKSLKSQPKPLANKPAAYLASASTIIKSKQDLTSALLSKKLEAILNNPERPLSGLSVVVVKAGKIVYNDNFGMRKIDQENPASSLPVNANTKFRIASISKMGSAIAIMQLAEKGKIDLDKDASSYLGFKLRNPHYPDIPITVRMLLSHTSSLRDADNYSFPPTESMEQVLSPGGKHWNNGIHWASSSEELQDLAPGKYFYYSNLAFGLLGTIIEATSGERFDRYMRTNILLPLGCNASYNVQDFSAADLNNLSVLYRKRDSTDQWNPKGTWYAQVDDYHGGPPTAPEGAETYVPGKNASWLSPQGGLRISAMDLSKIMRMFMNKGEFNGVRILSPESVNTIFTSQWKYDQEKGNGDTYGGLMLSYGLSSIILSNTGGDRLLRDCNIPMVGHIGDANGLLSCMFMDRDSKDGFICILSGTGADPAKNKGSYSSFFKWQEEMITAIFDTVLQDKKAAASLAKSATAIH